MSPLRTPRIFSLPRSIALPCLAASIAFIAPAALAGGHGHAPDAAASTTPAVEVAQLQRQLADLHRRLAALEKRQTVTTVASTDKASP